VGGRAGGDGLGGCAYVGGAGLGMGSSEPKLSSWSDGEPSHDSTPASITRPLSPHSQTRPARPASARCTWCPPPVSSSSRSPTWPPAPLPPCTASSFPPSPPRPSPPRRCSRSTRQPRSCREGRRAGWSMSRPQRCGATHSRANAPRSPPLPLQPLRPPALPPLPLYATSPLQSNVVSFLPSRPPHDHAST
jgi:hypothetical protein